jgi:methionyl-tRNA formyltransferase
VIGCGAGAVRLLEVQPEGKKTMTWQAFANGHNPEPGQSFTPEQPGAE